MAGPDTKMVSFRVEQPVLTAIDRQADELGVDRSTYCIQAMTQRLARKHRNQRAAEMGAPRQLSEVIEEYRRRLATTGDGSSPEMIAALFATATWKLVSTQFDDDACEAAMTEALRRVLDESHVEQDELAARLAKSTEMEPTGGDS